MKTAKRKRLERAGWRLVSTERFLELSDEEKVLVAEKLALAAVERMKTSQSQVAKIETDDPWFKPSQYDLRKRASIRLGPMTRLPCS